METSSISLKWSDYAQNTNYSYAAKTEVQKIQQPQGNYTPENTTLDKERFKSDAYLREINVEWLKRVGLDIYVQEAFNILNDYISTIAK